MSSIRRRRLALESLAALALALVPSSALVASPSEAAPSEPSEDALSGEAAIFARFADLALPETEARLEKLLGRKDTAGRVTTITRTLTKDGVTAKAIERDLLTLIKGLEPEEADITLAALMLDYYDQAVADRLAEGDLRLNEAFDLMTDRADVVVGAAYGPIAARDSHNPRARAIRKVRRRI